jgi:tetratricopeptide (TPR) repeat protein
LAFALQAMLHHEEGRPRHAYESALRVLALDPDLVDSPVDPAVFWTDLTADLIDLGNPARAAELLRHEIARGAGRPDALAACLQENLGRSSAVAGDLGAAAEAYRKAVGLDPARYRSLMGAAQASLREGRPSEAVPLLEQAVRVDPETPDAYYTLSIAYRMLGRPGDAAEALREHAERSRDRPQTSGMGYIPGREAPASNRPG